MALQIDGRDRTLRSRAARDGLDFVEPSHVIERNFDAQIELLRRAGIDDGHRPIRGDDGTWLGIEEQDRILFRGSLRSHRRVLRLRPRKRATSSSGRCVAESPILCSFRPQRCSSRSSESAR